MRRLTSATETLRPGLQVHLAQVAIVRGPVAVARTIVAGQIARGLGGRQHIVGRHRQLCVRQRNLHDLAAHPAILRHRSIDGATDIGAEPLRKIFLREPQAQPRDRPAPDRARSPRLGRSSDGRVPRIETRHRVEQYRQVGGGLRHGAALVEAGGERDHPVARDHAIGRLKPGYTAERGRQPDGAARVGPGGGGCQPRRHRAGRTA